MKVKLIDYIKPADVRVAQAALTSYWSEWSLDNVEKISEKDAEIHVPRVLSYGHEGILEHVVLQFAVEGCSRACTHQLVRHRHMSFVQRSQRYITEEENDLFVVPPTMKSQKIRISTELIEKVFDLSDGHVKIVPPLDSDETEVTAGEFYNTITRLTMESYKALIAAGIPTEDARYVLPQGTKSKIFITTNLREFKHFIGLRTCMRAQWEIRTLAWKMLEEVVKHDDLRKLVEWAKIGPRCIQLGYCPEKELMPIPGCVSKMKKTFMKIVRD